MPAPSAPSRDGRADSGIELVRAATRGDADAKTELVRAHQRGVFHLLGRMLAPSGLGHLVDDLAQDVFLRAFRSLDRFDADGTAKFSTWLLTIASRVAINELARKRPRTVPLDDLVESIAGPAAADTDARTRSVARALGRALTQLSPEYRAVFVLRHGHGLDNGEIAEILEIPVGTVKSRWSRARATLRESLREALDE